MFPASPTEACLRLGRECRGEWISDVDEKCAQKRKRCNTNETSAFVLHVRYATVNIFESTKHTFREFWLGLGAEGDCLELECVDETLENSKYFLNAQSSRKKALHLGALRRRSVLCRPKTKAQQKPVLILVHENVPEKTFLCRKDIETEGVWCVEDDLTPRGAYEDLVAGKSVVHGFSVSPTTHSVLAFAASALKKMDAEFGVTCAPLSLYHGTCVSASRALFSKTVNERRFEPSLGMLGRGVYVGDFFRACRFAARAPAPKLDKDAMAVHATHATHAPLATHAAHAKQKDLVSTAASESSAADAATAASAEISEGDVVSESLRVVDLSYMLRPQGAGSIVRVRVFAQPQDFFQGHRKQELCVCADCKSKVEANPRFAAVARIVDHETTWASRLSCVDLLVENMQPSAAATFQTSAIPTLEKSPTIQKPFVGVHLAVSDHTLLSPFRSVFGGHYITRSDEWCIEPRFVLPWDATLLDMTSVEAATYNPLERGQRIL